MAIYYSDEHQILKCPQCGNRAFFVLPVYVFKEENKIAQMELVKTVLECTQCTARPFSYDEDMKIKTEA